MNYYHQRTLTLSDSVSEVQAGEKPLIEYHFTQRIGHLNNGTLLGEFEWEMRILKFLAFSNTMDK